MSLMVRDAPLTGCLWNFLIYGKMLVISYVVPSIVQACVTHFCSILRRIDVSLSQTLTKTFHVIDTVNLSQVAGEISLKSPGFRK